MAKKARYKLISNDSDYRKGYIDGMNDAFSESELDAYYTGVGYGKKMSGDKHIGFNNAEERRQFEKGIKNKEKHFKSYRAEPPSFWERLFGGAKLREENSVGKYRVKRLKRTGKKLSKKRIKAKRKKR